ncbi:MAG TPA: fibronectin type III domain-containing protein [Saprospiraceae bacterium]|nr:fibronectin type III domain-containing protein [Saprospiraceae bacterium]
MKQTLPSFIITLLLLFTWTTGALKANPECPLRIESTECAPAPEDLSLQSAESYCYTPDWTYTYDITETCATWSWGNVYGCNGYFVQWRYPGGSWNDFGGVCYQNYCNVTNLNPSCNYEWRVRSYCGYNNYSNWCNPVYFTTLGSYCHYSTWLSCYNITAYSATWQWESCYGADYYWVQWRYPGGSWYDLYGCPVYGTWVNVNQLNPCTSYEYRVRSHCYSGWSNWCYPYSFNTLCNNCSVPYGLQTKDIGDHQATLKWQPQSGAYSYSVQIRDHYGNWYDLPGSPTNGVWINAYNLTSCHTYEWRVRANCGYYESSSYWSAPQTFTTTCGHGCNAPSWVYTSGINSSSASLHWEQVSGANYYVVEWRAANGSWNELQGGPWTNSWADLTGLQPNTSYEWHVKSLCDDGFTSYWSPTTHFTTLGNACGLPFYRYTLPVTDSAATFHWSAVNGALNYSVQVRFANGIWVDAPGSPTTDSSLTVTGLLPDTTYEWRMQVNCSNGSSTSWLSAINFHTGNSSGCNKPGSLSSDSITLSSARLHWVDVQDSATYSVQIRVWPNGAWNQVSGSPVDTNYIVVDSLSQNTTYEWQVRTNCKGGLHSFWSSSAIFTTGGNGFNNDECAKAIVLTVADSCTATLASNVDATASLPSPVGGCAPNGNKDVWFRFTMPDVPNPTVTIRTGAGSLADVVMEVYTGADCSILSIITCEDNNDNGNGSAMPVINLTGTPNTTIWVRVWGIDGSTGTFTICVFNQISFDFTGAPRALTAAENELFTEFETVRTQEDVREVPQLRYSPNPVNDQLHVTVLQTEENRVIGLRILDYSGKVMISRDMEPVAESQFKSTMDVSGLAPGIYVLQVQTTSGMMTEKVTVVR